MASLGAPSSTAALVEPSQSLQALDVQKALAQEIEKIRKCN